MKKLLTTAALLGVILTGSACDRQPTPEQLRPTYAGPNGECMEADDEPCDDDPFDTDEDDIHLPTPAVRTSPRPMMTANQPVPVKTAATKKRR
jgi:hypothetical protein